MAANNEKFWRALRVALLLGTILVGVALAYGALNQRVTYVETAVETVDNNEKAIVRIEADIEYIKKGIDEIKAELRDE